MNRHVRRPPPSARHVAGAWEPPVRPSWPVARRVRGAPDTGAVSSRVRPMKPASPPQPARRLVRRPKPPRRSARSPSWMHVGRARRFGSNVPAAPAHTRLPPAPVSTTRAATRPGLLPMPKPAPCARLRLVAEHATPFWTTPRRGRSGTVTSPVSTRRLKTRAVFPDAMTSTRTDSAISPHCLNARRCTAASPVRAVPRSPASRAAHEPAKWHSPRQTARRAGGACRAASWGARATSAARVAAWISTPRRPRISSRCPHASPSSAQRSAGPDANGSTLRRGGHLGLRAS